MCKTPQYFEKLDTGMIFHTVQIHMKFKFIIICLVSISCVGAKKKWNVIAEKISGSWVRLIALPAGEITVVHAAS